MKKKVVAVVFSCLIILVVAVLVGQHFAGARPFKDLTTEEVVEIRVKLLPPNAERMLTDEEIAQLVLLLNDIVTYEADQAYGAYNGQSVLFTITKTDGTVTTVTVYNPFVVIDDVGYRAKSAPCEALNRFANDLL